MVRPLRSYRSLYRRRHIDYRYGARAGIYAQRKEMGELSPMARFIPRSFGVKRRYHLEERFFHLPLRRISTCCNQLLDRKTEAFPNTCIPHNNIYADL